MESNPKGKGDWAKWKKRPSGRNAVVNSLLQQDSWPDSQPQQLPGHNWYEAQPSVNGVELPPNPQNDSAEWPTLGDATNSPAAAPNSTQKQKRRKARSKTSQLIPNGVEIPQEQVVTETAEPKEIGSGRDSSVDNRKVKEMTFVNSNIKVLQNPQHRVSQSQKSKSPKKVVNSGKLLVPPDLDGPKSSPKFAKRQVSDAGPNRTTSPGLFRVNIDRCLADLKSFGQPEMFLEEFTLVEGFFNFRDFFLRVRQKPHGYHVIATMGEFVREMLYAGDVGLVECKRDVVYVLREMMQLRFNKNAARDKIQVTFSPLTVQMLAREFIYTLKKVVQRFPDAKLFCSICDFHIQTVDHALQHFRGNDHEKFKKDRLLIEQLHLIPEPCEAQFDALSSAVLNVSQQFGRSSVELGLCQKLTLALSQLVQTHIHPECGLLMYGSCLIGTALKTSNLNLQLIYPDTQMDHAFALKAFHALILVQSVIGLEQIEEHYEARWPSITFKPVGMDVLCVVSVQNDLAVRVNSLVATYMRLVPAIISLGQAWRYWAKSCDLCDYATCGVPAYAYDLMLIYYLQQRKTPVLPVLQELSRKDGQDYETNIDQLRSLYPSWDQKLHLGRLWYGLLRFYAIEDHQATVICIRQSKLLSREEKSWNKKRIAIEDPYAPTRNVVQLTPKMYDYFFSCLCKTYCYCSIPRNAQGPLYALDNCQLQSRPKKKSPKVKSASPPLETDVFPPDRQTSSEESAGRVETIKETSADVVNEPPQGVRVYDRSQMKDIQQQVELKGDAVTLPFYLASIQRQPNSPVSYSVTSGVEPTDLSPPEPLLTGVVYQQVSMSPPSLTTPVDWAVHSIPTEECFTHENNSEPPKIQTLESYDSSTTDVESLPQCVKKDNGDDIVFAVPVGVEDLEEKMNDLSLLGETVVNNDEVCEKSPVRPQMLTEEDQRRMDAIVAEVSPVVSAMKLEDFVFDFKCEDLIGGKKPLMTCSYCQGEHKTDICPQEELPPLSHLPPLLHEYQAVMSQFLSDVPKRYCMPQQRVQFQIQFTANLQRILQLEYRHDATLTLFGSAVNNFGFSDSDMDLCLTFTEPTLSPEIDPIMAIKRVAKILHRKVPAVVAVTAVTKAKVPIVKCVDKFTHIDIDISLYNTLAIRNSRLIALYAQLDSRVWALGYVVKRFARECDIGDASKGSLSSYAYILMVIHYLQQRSPPVLPCLQQIGRDPAQTHHYTVDGWDTYFFENLRVLPTVWPGYGQNRESLCSLWVGFLRYYTEAFDFQRRVICIRQLDPLMKFEKLWGDRKMAIEDPFNLSHNLASGLSRRMFNYIQRALIRGRNLFGYSLGGEALIQRFGQAFSFDQLEGYYFGPNLKPKVPPPRDRLCHRCGHVGHFVENCPRNHNRLATPGEGLDSGTDTEVEAD